MVQHKSVLLEEAVKQLHIKPNGIYVDATTGGGGHSSEILKRLSNGHLYCFDQDEYAYKRSKECLDSIGKSYTFIHSNFIHLKNELLKLGVSKIDGILYDLGVSSFQLDMKERGFSYKQDAYLDMRMNPSQLLTAYEIVNTYSYEELVKIFYQYGEEPFSKSIARQIEKERMDKPIRTTLELVEVIKRSLPQKVLKQKGHPAKQVFQALRIAVNDELRAFEDSIQQALELLNSDGYAVVITFHSLEDRICKSIFKNASTPHNIEGLPIMLEEEAPFELITHKPIVPNVEEIEENNRAHSAKMRVIRKR